MQDNRQLISLPGSIVLLVNQELVKTVHAVAMQSLPGYNFDAENTVRDLLKNVWVVFVEGSILHLVTRYITFITKYQPQKYFLLDQCQKTGSDDIALAFREGYKLNAIWKIISDPSDAVYPENNSEQLWQIILDNGNLNSSSAQQEPYEVPVLRSVSSKDEALKIPEELESLGLEIAQKFNIDSESVTKVIVEFLKKNILFSFQKHPYFTFAKSVMPKDPYYIPSSGDVHDEPRSLSLEESKEISEKLASVLNIAQDDVDSLIQELIEAKTDEIQNENLPQESQAINPAKEKPDAPAYEAGEKIHFTPPASPLQSDIKPENTPKISINEESLQEQSAIDDLVKKLLNEQDKTVPPVNESGFRETETLSLAVNQNNAINFSLTPNDDDDSSDDGVQDNDKDDLESTPGLFSLNNPDENNKSEIEADTGVRGESVQCVKETAADTLYTPQKTESQTVNPADNLKKEMDLPEPKTSESAILKINYAPDEKKDSYADFSFAIAPAEQPTEFTEDESVDGNNNNEDFSISIDFEKEPIQSIPDSQRNFISESQSESENSKPATKNTAPETVKPDLFNSFSILDANNTDTSFLSKETGEIGDQKAETESAAEPFSIFELGAIDQLITDKQKAQNNISNHESSRENAGEVLWDSANLPENASTVNEEQFAYPIESAGDIPIYFTHNNDIALDPSLSTDIPLVNLVLTNFNRFQIRPSIKTIDFLPHLGEFLNELSKSNLIKQLIFLGNDDKEIESLTVYFDHEYYTLLTGQNPEQLWDLIKMPLINNYRETFTSLERQYSALQAAQQSMPNMDRHLKEQEQLLDSLQESGSFMYNFYKKEIYKNKSFHDICYQLYLLTKKQFNISVKLDQKMRPAFQKQSIYHITNKKKIADMEKKHARINKLLMYHIQKLDTECHNVIQKLMQNPEYQGEYKKRQRLIKDWENNDNFIQSTLDKLAELEPELKERNMDKLRNGNLQKNLNKKIDIVSQKREIASMWWKLISDDASFWPYYLSMIPYTILLSNPQNPIFKTIQPTLCVIYDSIGQNLPSKLMSAKNSSYILVIGDNEITLTPGNANSQTAKHTGFMEIIRNAKEKLSDLKEVRDLLGIPENVFDIIWSEAAR
ncbi:MAG: hypothetical protein ACM3WV_06615 [Bacillota bacterium]